MKTSFSHSLTLLTLLSAFLLCAAQAKDGPTGKLKATLVYATNSPEGDGNAKPVPSNLNSAISKKKLPFKHFYLLGSDTKPIRPGAVNELRPNSQIKISFQPSGKGVALDYFQGGKKAFSTKAPLTSGKPFIITGPTWRKGKVIIILEHRS